MQLVQCYNASNFSLTRDVNSLNLHLSKTFYGYKTAKRKNMR